jgi:hypothetical protein
VHRLDRTVSMFSNSPQDGGGFAQSVATLGDTIAILGAPNEFSSMGRAYIRDLTSGTQIELAPPGMVQGALFGQAVTSAGSFVLVGAPGANVVHVFTSGGSFVRSLTSPGQGSLFGFALAPFDATSFLVAALSGDAYRMDLDGNVLQTYTSDGASGWGWAITTVSGFVCVAAIDEAGPGGVVGSVHVYDAAAGTFQRKIFSPDQQTTFGFGIAIAPFQGNLAVGCPVSSTLGSAFVMNPATGAQILRIDNPDSSGSGFAFGLAQVDQLLAIGAESNGGFGRALLYDASGNLQHTLESPNPRFGGSFGHALAANNAGLLVSAYQEDVNPTAAGRAYFFAAQQTGGGGPVFDADVTLESPNPQGGGDFGRRVAFAGLSLVVGAPGESGSEGLVYVFNLQQQALARTIASPNPQEGGGFGSGLAANAGLIAIGAPGEDSRGVGTSGRAYLYNAGTGALMLSFQSDFPKGTGAYGASVAASAANVAVGAPAEDVTGTSAAGRVYFYDCIVDTPLVVVVSPSPTQDGLFGLGVAVFGTDVYVGAPGESGGNGVVYCFNGITGTLVRTITAPDGGLFGFALGTVGNDLLVGAPGALRAYRINRSTGQVVATYEAPNSQQGDAFGHAVASNSAGDVAVGAPGANAGTGSVYTFVASTGAFQNEFQSPNSGGEGGEFGASIAGLGSGGAVGAPGETATGVGGAGHVYLHPNASG